MNLIECLLRIADTGLYAMVLEIFKHGITRSGELIFLGLLQAHVCSSTMINEKIRRSVSLDIVDNTETRIDSINYSNISRQ